MTTRPRPRIPAAAVAAALVLATALGACGDDATTTAPASTADQGLATTATAPDATDPVTDGQLRVSRMWARTSPSMATAGAVYLVIDNDTDTDDRLVAAAVDPSIAATVELHQTTMEMSGGDDAMDDDAMDDDATGDDGSMDDDAMDDDATGDDGSMGEGSMGAGSMGSDQASPGMMRMAPVEDIPVLARSSTVLEPGGYHIMLLDLAAPLEVGTTIEVTLTFAEAGEIVETADVLDAAP